MGASAGCGAVANGIEPVVDMLAAGCISTPLAASAGAATAGAATGMFEGFVDAGCADGADTGADDADGAKDTGSDSSGARATDLARCGACATVLSTSSSS